MPASDEFYLGLKRKLISSRSREEQDAYLDLWISATFLATEYDARQWGFSPATWMSKERAEMLSQSALRRARLRSSLP